MDVNQLLDKAIKLGYKGEEAEEFVERLVKEQEARDERAANREMEREKERLRLEKERLHLEKEKREIEHEEREKQRKHELEVLKLRSQTSHSLSSDTSLVKSLPKIPPFDDSVDEIDMYIERFEKIARFHGWGENNYVTLLGTLLRGKALKVYCNLSSDILSNYEEFKKALLKAFKVNSNVYRKRFREESILPDESFVQLNCRLGQYFDKWLELSEVGKDYDSVRDFMIYDQLLSSCSHDLRNFLLEQKFKSSSELAESADRYLMAHGIKKCKKSRTSSTKDSVANSKVPASSSPQASPEVKCHHCGEKGHIRPNCPTLKLNKKKVSDSYVPKIGVVLDREEKLTNCVTDMGQIFDKSVEIIFDTGCNTVVVNEGLVPSDYCLGKKVKVYDYLGRPLYLKTVNCFITSKFFSGWVKAIVAPIKCTDVIIGLIPGLKSNVNSGLKLISTGETVEKVNVVTRAQAKSSDDSVVPLTSKTINSLGLNHTDFSSNQNSCVTLETIRKYVESETICSVKNRKIKYVRVGNIIYRKCIESKDIADVDRMQIVVPKAYRELVMKLAHESLMAGHFSSRKTTELVFQKFYWPRASLDIHRFCKSCHSCQKFSRKPTKVPLVKRPIVSEPFSRIAIDLVGPINPSSLRGHKYILTIIDMATRYPEAVPLRNIDTVSVAEALVEIFCRVGVPREILSDRGTQFKSELMSEINRLLSIKALYTTPYHAACNGMVERLNGTLKNMLKKICIDHPNEWDRYINVALFAYREIPNDTLKFSPFELLYGRNVRGPLSILHELVSNDAIDSELKPSYQYVVDLRTKLQDMAKTAIDNSEISATKYKEYFDKKTTTRKFKVNDEVLIMRPTSSNKFVMQWKGPYIISGIHANGVDYFVKVGTKTKLYHANMLKAYYRRTNFIHSEIGCINDSNKLFEAISCDDSPTIVENINSVEEKISSSEADDANLYLLGRPGSININPNLSNEQVNDLSELLDSFSDVLSDLPGRTKTISHKINLYSNESIRHKNYPVPLNLVEDFEKEVNKMLEMDVIQPSTSDFCSPVVFVRKSNGDLRICVDFRELNKHTIFDAEPMPSINDDLHKFRGAKYFSELDLAKGYWQVNLDIESRKFTAFKTKYGLMEFKVMPFGLSTACATFVRLMRRVLANLPHVSCYFDNIVIYSENWKEHLNHLESVLLRLREHGLTAGPGKCFIGFPEIKYLGYTVGNDTLQTIKSRIENIVQLPLPNTKKSLRSFMGTVGYYNRFIPNFSMLASPINDLLKKNSPNNLIWDKHRENCFNKLKNCLVEYPILMLPDVDKVFYLRTDASYYGLGAAILQEHDNILKPVCFAGKKLTTSEQKYSTVEKECYAIVWGINRFKEYLYGKEFVLQTDHMPLKFLCGMKNKNDRLIRWILSLQPYKFVIEYIKGTDNVCADMISRCI